jgi:hypothetical protein
MKPADEQLDLLADKAHARRSDPETSQAAARSITLPVLRQSQKAVLACFTIYGPMHHELLIQTYALGRQSQPWPRQSPSGLRTRTKELVNAGYARDTGRRVKLISGRSSNVWEAV